MLFGGVRNGSVVRTTVFHQITPGFEFIIFWFLVFVYNPPYHQPPHYSVESARWKTGTSNTCRCIYQFMMTIFQDVLFMQTDDSISLKKGDVLRKSVNKTFKTLCERCERMNQTSRYKHFVVTLAQQRTLNKRHFLNIYLLAYKIFKIQQT